MKAITIALMITLAGFVAAGWHIWKSYTGYKDALTRDFQFQFLISSLNSGPAMTSIVRNAATTGNLEDEGEYLHLAKDVDNAIKEIKRLAPDSEILEIAKKIAASNSRLIAMEKRALDLVRAGRKEQAKELVYGQEYREHIERFDDGNHSLSQSLKSKVEKEVLSMRRRTFFAFSIVVGSVPVLIFVWIVVLSIVRRRLIERSHQESVNSVIAALEQKLSALSTPADVEMEVLNAADELLGWDASYVVLYDRETDQFHSLLNFDVIEGRRCRIPPPGVKSEKAYFLRLVLSEGPKLVLRKTPEDDARYKIIPFGNETRLSRSLLFTPIRKGENTIGVISIQSYSRDAYDESDLRLFQMLAERCSGALYRAMAETSLLESEEKFRLLTEQIANSVIIYDRDFTIDYVNREFEKLTGYDRGELIGKRRRALIPEDRNPGAFENIPPLLESGSVYSGVLIKQKKNGEFYHDETTITPLRDSAGVITHYVETGKDITERIHAEENLRKAHDELEKRVEERTKELSLSNNLLRQENIERKRAEQELARSEAIYREAIENASGVPYRFLYNQGRYDFVGKEILTLLGYSPEEFSFNMLEHCVKEIIILDPDAPMDHLQYVQAFKRGELDQYRADLRVITKNGEQKWVSDCSVPIRDDKTGRVIGSLGILQDITQRKRVEEEARMQRERLIQADKMVSLGIMVSGVAHEINNPNNFIMLNTPILLESWQSIEPILKQYYDYNGDFVVGGLNYSEMRDHIPVLFSGVVEGAKRIKNIVQELRDFARQYPAEMKETVNINNIVNSALTLLSNMIKKTTDYFHVEYGSDLPPIKGNFQRIEQALINLIQNSCQALPSRDKAIHVSTSYDKKQDSIVIQVKDEGVGIPPETMKHIMDPFFTTKRNTGGTGLGLSISSNIVNEHDGKLIINSDKDKGTVVSVILPLNIQTDSVDN